MQERNRGLTLQKIFVFNLLLSRTQGGMNEVKKIGQICILFKKYYCYSLFCLLMCPCLYESNIVKILSDF